MECGSLRRTILKRKWVVSFERLEDQEVAGLKKPFSEEKVFNALSGLVGTKHQLQMGFP